MSTPLETFGNIRFLTGSTIKNFWLRQRFYHRQKNDIVGNSVAHSLYFKYDTRSKLTLADITNIIDGDGTWSAAYTYKNTGDIMSKTIESSASFGSVLGHGLSTFVPCKEACDAVYPMDVFE